MNYFSAILRRSGLDIRGVAAEFGASPETVLLWDSGETQAPDRVIRTLEILADFAPAHVEPHAQPPVTLASAAAWPAVQNELDDRKRKASLGQFLTPPKIANFMARLFEFPPGGVVRLLDAGAGRAALTLAVVDRWKAGGGSGTLSASAYEFDGAILPELRTALAEVASNNIRTELIEGDFIALTAKEVRDGGARQFTHAILNPPYKKITNSSQHRGFLRLAGLETVNLYSGFVGLALELLKNGGELVAIIPRSFCNGPYYLPFRRWIFARAAIRQIHVFRSRSCAFKSDEVLQENVIMHLKRGARQSGVIISTSSDGEFADYGQRTCPFDKIVFPGDDEQFIHIPSDDDDDALLATSAFRYTLKEIGVEVSTGPVVDFRLRGQLRAGPEPGTVPLLYPGHFKSGSLQWPKAGFKKANVIVRSAATEKWLYPGGFYTVVRRFSAKEEPRRIVANVVDPKFAAGAMIGFENHLNVFHARRQPLAETIARGLAVYLNSTPVDRYFRRFNGHTQVNATDLHAMRYPGRSALEALGHWALSAGNPEQAAIDVEVERLA